MRPTIMFLYLLYHSKVEFLAFLPRLQLFLQARSPEIAAFKTSAGPFDEPVSKEAQGQLGIVWIRRVGGQMVRVRVSTAIQF